MVKYMGCSVCDNEKGRDSCVGEKRPVNTCLKMVALPNSDSNQDEWTGRNTGFCGASEG